MSLIFETKNFILESHETPEVDRAEGGHIKITPKVPVEDRTRLTPRQSVELAWLTTLAGEAMVRGMASRGIDIGRINYQDNGNWKPELHVHLYGRAKTALMQKYGDPIVPGHRDTFRPLDQDDREALRAAIEDLHQEERFSEQAWQLS